MYVIKQKSQTATFKHISIDGNRTPSIIVEFSTPEHSKEELDSPAVSALGVRSRKLSN
jgi:hypothetical protein